MSIATLRSRTAAQHGALTPNRIGINRANLVPVNCIKWDIPTVINTNIRGALSCKLDEIYSTAQKYSADIACVTETWCRESVPDAALQIPGYTNVRRDRQDGRQHGGIMMYVRDSTPFQHWEDLNVTTLEAIWVTIHMNCLPRGISNITIGLIYHPPGSQDLPMLNHIIASIDHIRRRYPETGVILCGDVNHLRDTRLKNDLQLKQLVKTATRGNSILDKVYTDCSQYYGRPVVLSPVGLSDHGVVLCQPALAADYEAPSTYMAQTRCMGANEQSMLLVALKNTTWEDVYRADSCTLMYDKFESKLKFLIDTHLPVKTVKRCSNDRPWVTDEFRHLIDRRNTAFHTGSTLFPYLRNKANRLRKRLRRNYFASKVNGAAAGDRDWWKCIRDITGLRTNSRSAGLTSMVNSVSGGNIEEFGNRVNSFLHSVGAHFAPLREGDYRLSPHVIRDEYIISIEQVEERLAKLNSRKAMGPDGMPTWVFHAFAPLLAPPICAIFNASIRESTLPTVWKCATIVPIPKTNPPRSVEKDLRPISLTPVLSKELEHFVCLWIMKIVGDRIDQCQFGAVCGSSTVHALVDLVHDWANRTDRSNTMIRAVLLDYRKAFDLIDHHILLQKLDNLGLPGFIVSWVAAFLQGRKQQVKIDQYVTDWLPVHAGVPQGTRLGPLLFLIMINNLLEAHRRIKFVDDTISWEVCHASGSGSEIQSILSDASTWSLDNMMQLNADKTKEMVISFSQKFHLGDLPALTLDGKELERISSARILGVMVSSDLTWTHHVDYLCAKGNQRLYHVCLLRRAGASRKDMLTFYKAVIRSVMEYACPVWHTGLTADQSDRIEAIQRRALRMVRFAQPHDGAHI